MPKERAQQLFTKLKSLADQAQTDGLDFLGNLSSLLPESDRFQPNVKVSRNQLQAMLSKSFPIQKRFWQAFEAEFSHPELSLNPSAHRITLDCDIRVALHQPRKHQEILSSKLSVSAGMKYAKREGRLYLEDPIIEQIDLKGLPPSMAVGFGSALNKFILSRIEETSVYQLNEKNASEKAIKSVLKEIVIRKDDVILVMGLNRRKTSD